MSKYTRQALKSKSGRSPRQRSLGYISVVTFFAVLAFVLVVAGVAYSALTSSIGPVHHEYHQKLFSTVSAQITQWLERHSGRVELLARDPDTARLMEASQAQARHRRQREMTELLGAQRVLLVPAGKESFHLGDYPRLNYAELDLLLQVKSTRFSAVEFHAFRDDGHLDIVWPVVADDEVVGTVLATFDRGPLIRFMDQTTVPLGGGWALNQLLPDGSPVTIGQWGKVSTQDDNDAFTGAVAGADWQLRLSHDNSGLSALTRHWGFLFWGMVGSILAGLAAALALQGRWLSRLLKHDGELLCAVTRDRLSGHWMGKDYAPKLAECQGPLNRLQALQWSVIGRSSGPRPPGNGQRDNLAEEDGLASEQASNGEEAGQFEASFPSIFFQTEDSVVVENQQQNGEGQGDAVALSASIFRAYDIRGVVDETLTPEVVHQIGRALGSEAWVAGEQSVVVGRDGRLSGPKLTEALISGLRASGRDVIDVGRVPTPVLYFATQYLSTRSGVVVTGSHNPPNYNGLKMVIKGETLAEAAIQRLRKRIMDQDFMAGDGGLSSQDLTADYIARVCADVRLARPLRVVMDCGNGAAGEVAPDLIRSLGCDLIELYCDVDGTFPNHHPDPSQPENLADLISAVKQEKADIGLAFDGDGDRLGVVDSHGNVIWPDRQMMLYAADVLKSKPGGEIIYDVKCTRHLHGVIQNNGGVPTMWKTGHSLIKKKLRESGALLAGEMSGHIFFNDRWFGFDDALYTAARLLEVLSKRSASSYEIFSALPDALSTPELRVDMAEGEHHAMVKRLKQEANFPGAQLITIDGVRAEFDFGWGLVRASNTTPSLILRFEADHEKGLAEIKALFRDVLLGLNPNLKLPF